MTDNNCIFCKIIKKEIKSDMLYEDDNLVAFRDINPQAPIHVLIVPKQHISKVSDLNQENKDLISDLILTANKIAEKLQIKKEGYRLVFNCGLQAGQEVPHIHLHLLGGRTFGWPPG
jgi:histidine triad (HIT) family protein